jgi:hypothetical protein
MRRNLGTIDLDTGEILDGVPVYVHAKVKWREGWFMGIQDAFIALAKDKDINGGTYRVLNYMFGKLGFENYICIQQKEICEVLDLKKQNVSSAIKLLLEKGIILPGPKLGRSSSYRLNPTYGWKGKVTNLAKTRLELIHSRQD